MTYNSTILCLKNPLLNQIFIGHYKLINISVGTEGGGGRGAPGARALPNQQGRGPVPQQPEQLPVRAVRYRPDYEI